MKLGFWLKWAWRDLRQRWLQVAAIAVIIAFGTGMFAAFGGQKDFRIEVYNHNYDLLNMYDLRMELADGSFIESDAVIEVLADVDGLATVETRLILPTLIEVPDGDAMTLIGGEIVGVQVDNSGPHVNSLWLDEGRGRMFSQEDDGALVAILDQKFADARELVPGSKLRVSGDVELDVIGAGLSPEYWMIVPENGGFLAEDTYGVIFVPLETAGAIAGRDGLVNDLIFLVEPDADRDVVQAAIEAQMAVSFPDTGFTITPKEDDYIYYTLFADLESDQVMFNFIATIFLMGASFGAFNLAGRIVAAQRRQIGISMALGVQRHKIAFRPMLIGLQIAVLGTILGFAAGYGINRAFVPLMDQVMPLPEWPTSALDVSAFGGAALLGVALPLVATLIPVWRAVRVPPVDAISTGTLVAKHGGLTGLARALPKLGNSFVRMPVNNVLAAPWRMVLTVAGIGIAIALMVMFIGLYDSIVATVDQGEAAFLYQAEDRLLVGMDFFYPSDSAIVENITAATDEQGDLLFQATETHLMVGGNLMDGDEEAFEVVVEFHDMANAIWVPNLIDGTLMNGEASIVLSEKAAEDLGVWVGDTVNLEHPQREGLMSFRNVVTPLVITGIHDNPMRAYAFMDNQYMDILGVTGLVNQVVAIPADGVPFTEVQRTLFTQPGVTTITTVEEFTQVFDNIMELLVGMILVAQIIVLFIAFLIAFNTTSINIDERQREVATMFAFGLPIRKVTRMLIQENLITAVFGIIFGSTLGYLILVYALEVQFAEDLPDLKLLVTISAENLLLSGALGVFVVSLVPLLSIRKMAKMDVPSTLRVME